jgi:NitT/TauT family transport system substrate-binding protein
VGAEEVVFHKDVKITSWKDVEGKRIARVPGSFAEFRFRVAAAHHGVDLSKVQLKDFGFSYVTLNLALKRRDVDALVIWAPGMVMPIVEGFGYLPPISIHDTPIGNINGVFGMSTAFLSKNPDVAEKLLRAFVEATQYYAGNAEEWVKGARGITGAEIPVLQEGIKHVELTNNIYMARAVSFAKIAFKENLVSKDASDVIGQWLHYDLLMKVTGKSRKELGG